MPSWGWEWAARSWQWRWDQAGVPGLTERRRSWKPPYLPRAGQGGRREGRGSELGPQEELRELNQETQRQHLSREPTEFEGGSACAKPNRPPPQNSVSPHPHWLQPCPLSVTAPCSAWNNEQGLGHTPESFAGEETKPPEAMPFAPGHTAGARWPWDLSLCCQPPLVPAAWLSLLLEHSAPPPPISIQGLIFLPASGGGEGFQLSTPQKQVPCHQTPSSGSAPAWLPCGPSDWLRPGGRPKDPWQSLQAEGGVGWVQVLGVDQGKGPH